MKKLLLVAVAFLLLTGCTVKQSGMDKILTLRSRFVQGETCAFDVRITADYGTEVCMFEMQCGTDSAGTVQFAVTEPKFQRSFLKHSSMNAPMILVWLKVI